MAKKDEAARANQPQIVEIKITVKKVGGEAQVLTWDNGVWAFDGPVYNRFIRWMGDVGADANRLNRGKRHDEGDES